MIMKMRKKKGRQKNNIETTQTEQRQKKGEQRNNVDKETQVEGKQTYKRTKLETA